MARVFVVADDIVDEGAVVTNETDDVLVGAVVGSDVGADFDVVESVDVTAAVAIDVDDVVEDADETGDFLK